MFFQNRSIRHKLSLVVISSSLIVLLLLGGLIGATEYFSMRRDLLKEQVTLAAILGQQLAIPLMDADRYTAKKILASLSSDSRVKAAYLFDLKSKPFAQYLDVNATAFVEDALTHDFKSAVSGQERIGPGWTEHFGFDHLALYAPVYFQDVLIGNLYLLASLDELQRKFLEVLFAVMLVGGVGIVLSWRLSGRLSRPISVPLLELSETMEKVSTAWDFSLRARRFSDDEVGQLVDGFNDMLTQIEIRDKKLEAHQAYLEDAVRERTRELSETVKELAAAKKQSDAANQAKSVFLANVTHELRTPLVGVLGMNELLLESSLDAQQKMLAETVQRSGQDLLELINQLLDFSRLESGNLDLQVAKVGLVGLVEEALREFGDAAREKGLALLCRVAPGAAWQVAADAQRLKQILHHLLDNAIKFTHQGSVRLEVTLTDEGETRFDVQDTGIGIDEASQAEIFDAFLQVDNSTSRLFGGTGIGLSVVRELTVLMHGQIQLESRQGVGSRFTVTLPLERIAADFPELSDKQRQRPVLVYCAQAAVRDMLVRLLLDLGFSAVGVEDRAQLLQSLKNADLHANRFDMLFFAQADGETSASDVLCAAEPYCRRIVCLHRTRQIPDSHGKILHVGYPLLRSFFQDESLYDDSDEVGLTEPAREHPAPPLRQVAIDGLHRLLVVDDNISTRELIAFSLDGMAWKTVEASNAHDALELLRQQEFQLILMDINMPGMDGLEAVRRLRDMGVSTPVFALTAHGDDELFEACMEVGMQGVLRKPFRQRELFALLEQHQASAGASPNRAEA